MNKNLIIPKALSPQTTHLKRGFKRLTIGLSSFDISRLSGESK
jgi:hypothetical protein